jgi:drug/metabolite transporter (DMT)-like permease
MPPPPLWALGAMFIAVCAMGSGGIWFALLGDTPPMLRVSWRLFVTALLQCPLFLREKYVGAKLGDKPFEPLTPDFFARWRAHLGIMIVSGIFLAIHFCAWSWSINYTSLAHSLLFVSTSPLFMVAFAAIRHAASRLAILYGIISLSTSSVDTTTTTTTPSTTSTTTNADAVINTDEVHPNTVSNVKVAVDEDVTDTINTTSTSSLTTAALVLYLTRSLSPERSRPPTTLEVSGTVLSFIAAAILIVSASETNSNSKSSAGFADEPTVTVAGDLVALVGGFAVWIYIEVGGNLRSWMPLFHYAFPVTLTSSIASFLFSLVLEGPSLSFSGLGANTPLGFLGSWNRFQVVLGAAFFSGMLGHTIANLALSHLSPLLVSVSFLWEPLIGSFLGYLVGVQGVPGVATLVAGPLLLIGAFLCTIGGRDSGVDLIKIIVDLKLRFCGHLQGHHEQLK